MTHTSNTSSDDLVDQVVGLAPGSAIHALRHKRDKVVAATQGSYEALFDPELAGLSLAERLLVAVYACRLTPAPGLFEFYRGRLMDLDLEGQGLKGQGLDAATRIAVESGDPSTLTDPRLRAMLGFTRTLIERPIDGDRAALTRLPAAGISTPAVVALAQLIAFVSYQTRVVAGLAAMKAATR